MDRGRGLQSQPVVSARLPVGAPGSSLFTPMPGRLRGAGLEALGRDPRRGICVQASGGLGARDWECVPSSR